MLGRLKHGGIGQESLSHFRLAATDPGAKRREVGGEAEGGTTPAARDVLREALEGGADESDVGFLATILAWPTSPRPPRRST